MGNTSESVSREIEAMATIGRVLGDLTDPSARQRVLKWAAERFASEQPVVPAIVPVVAAQPAVVVAPALATDADLLVDSLNDMFAVATPYVDDDLGEFAAPAAQTQTQPVEEMRKLPLETLLRSLASDFRAFADEWNGAAA
jgi:hypothetical protein